MSEENKGSIKGYNQELEENISKKVDQMKETENEESQEIDFTDSTDVSAGWECGGNYKTTMQ